MSVSRRQMSLDLREPSVPRILKTRARPANDKSFQTLAPVSVPTVRGTPSVHDLIEQVQDEDRQRLLEPTSLPKILRGGAPYRRPQTAIISIAAQAAYERRMAGEQVVRKFVSAHDRKLSRLVHKLRFR